ncbi:MAG: hypothetical protein HY656_02365 [Acidobacteria bacterium]|nr:hypothetical protein [Acidobacteriota bacterium]
MGKADPADVYAIALQPPPVWWKRLLWRPSPACAHADALAAIVLNPDWVRLRNGAQAAVRQPPRPSITVCPECLLQLLEPELTAPNRRVVAFEPAKEGLSALAFIEQDHLGDSGLPAEDLIHCQSLVAEPLGGCQKCGQPAMHLLVKRSSTSEKGKLVTFRGGKEYYCPAHGAERLLGLLRERLPQRPVGCINFPYGERGLYIPAD